MMGMIIHRAMALFTDNTGKRSFDDMNESAEMNESAAEKFDEVHLKSIIQKVGCVINSYPKSIKPKFQFEDDCPEYMLLPKGGVTALYQSTLNYLTNACKATKEGEIVLAMSATDEMLHIECRDSGPGVKQER